VASTSSSVLGEVIEEGDAEEVFHHPKHELTKKYLAGAFS
jgi:phosphate transport system ATP-binding protein